VRQDQPAPPPHGQLLIIIFGFALIFIFLFHFLDHHDFFHLFPHFFFFDFLLHSPSSAFFKFFILLSFEIVCELFGLLSILGETVFLFVEELFAELLILFTTEGLLV